MKQYLKVRHAQGIHNVALEEKGGTDDIGDPHFSPKLLDAPLSPKGIKQVSEQQKEILKSGLINTVQLVITSPLRRAVETAVGIFRGQKVINQSDNFPPIVALELCRERMGLYPCDRRESISTRRICFPEIDFTMVESDEDALWREEERENLEEVSARGLRFLKWLWERPEKEIAVVSHGIFLQQTLRALHEKVSIPLEDSLLTRFANCELRSIRIDKSDMEVLTTYNCRKNAAPTSSSLHTLE
ncbi:Phosphoglycerate mutase family protein [Raphanus sativus]|nr:Phosphoglycerate mutase family protein [Raphanus sativus]KAJ4879093.1 Phosphoglycerate mutase family protein [Raphanus sativus]